MEEPLIGFESYDEKTITLLRHRFGVGLISSRPIRFMDVIIWLDEHQRIHRDGNFPAVERKDGSKEYWENGRKRA